MCRRSLASAAICVCLIVAAAAAVVAAAAPQLDDRPSAVAQWRPRHISDNRCVAAEAASRSGAMGEALRWMSVNDSPCIFHVAGFWAYEYCVDRWIRQLHIENSHITHDIIIGVGPLALSDSSLIRSIPVYRPPAGNGPRRFRETLLQEMNPATSPSADPGFKCGLLPAQPGQSALVRPVSDYRQGSYCEASSTPREATIVLTCEQDVQHLFAFNISEPEPCRYIVFLYGMAVCKAMAGDTFDPEEAGRMFERVPSSQKPKSGNHPLRPRHSPEPTAESVSPKPEPDSTRLTAEQSRKFHGQLVQDLYTDEKHKQFRSVGRGAPGAGAPDGSSSPSTSQDSTEGLKAKKGSETAEEAAQYPFEDSLIFSL